MTPPANKSPSRTRESIFGPRSEGELKSTEEQFLHLNREGREPPVLTDALVKRIIRVYIEEQEMIPVLREQLSRWLKANPTEKQRKELARTRKNLTRLDKLTKEILDLARELRNFTIEKVLAKDDLNAALAFLSGKMRQWL